MCLYDIKKQWVRGSLQKIIAYKVLSQCDKGFEIWRAGIIIKIGETYVDTKKYILSRDMFENENGYHSPSYKCGFHAFLNLDDAREFSRRTFSEDVVVEVELTQITAIGRQKMSDYLMWDKENHVFFDVIVGRKMRVIGKI